MQRSMSILFATLALAAGLAGCTDDGHHDHDHGMDDHGSMDHGSMDHSGTHAASEEMSVSIAVHEDPKSGYNVEITTVGFEFDPESASLDHEDGKGHAHIYVDGVKINRVYGHWYHLSLDSGDHEVMVELNGNDHLKYTWNDEPVEASVTVSVP